MGRLFDPLSLRERGRGEGSAKAGKAGKYGRGIKVPLLMIAKELTCLRRTFIRPSGTFSRREKG